MCAYPGERTNKSDGRPEDYSQRIDKLEAYIRRLGGDPQLVEKIIEDRSGSEASCMKRTDVHNGTQAGLVEHDEQVTYIEAYATIRSFAIVKTLLTATCQTDVVQLERHEEDRRRTAATVYSSFQCA